MEGLDWKKEVRKYVTVYRSLEHATTGESLAELLYKRKMKGKIPDIGKTRVVEQEVRGRDTEKKGKMKLYADESRGAKDSEANVGDAGLVHQEKVDKFTTPFIPTPYTVVHKKGNQVVVESPMDVQYARNTTHVGKYHRRPQETYAEVTATAKVVDTVDGENKTKDIVVGAYAHQESRSAYAQQENRGAYAEQENRVCATGESWRVCATGESRRVRATGEFQH